ncbi:hypothetical protein [Janthinobacterium psychrotolerans]|uniref:Uncharacterized protein n=1 Tax=Janthinobacterium psychrotolerans TaxID=1747903 RepID=A0A1A7C5Q8_9BURK|nr:hypothetical protein [Janthinobacterium psychrotolerans]OBV39633.1 hypothetical protein ASR47_101122 [Janthinobacterium psychrotolerans]
MPASVGDIYSVYCEKLRQYVACQVTALKEDRGRKGAQLAAVLELDWSGDALPDAQAIASMKPLICDFYSRGAHVDHCWLGASVPSNYTLVGNLAPLVIDGLDSYGGGWVTGNSLYLQRRWNTIDADKRRRFKAASRNVEVTVGGRVLRQDTSKIDDSILQGIHDLSELDQLPCLSIIHTRHGTPALLDFIKGNPFVTELSWQAAQVAELDLRQTRMRRLIVDPAALRSLQLNDDLNDLTLDGTPALKLAVHHPLGGRGLTLHCSGAVPAFAGLDQLGALSLTTVKEIDLDTVARRFPRLTALRIWGQPGMVANLQAIAALPQLLTFTTYDMFGFTPQQFPMPQQLPHLSMLWMTSVPADVAKEIKARYKKTAKHGGVPELDLAIRQPRKPEWLAENLHNPFRDWDGRQQIPAAYAKKAAQAYKTLLAATRTIDAALDAEAVHALLCAAVREYVAVFNKMERRSSVIETEERDEIGTVLFQVLDQLAQQGQAQGRVTLRVAQLHELFDQSREF